MRLLLGWCRCVQLHALRTVVLTRLHRILVLSPADPISKRPFEMAMPRIHPYVKHGFPIAVCHKCSGCSANDLLCGKAAWSEIELKKGTVELVTTAEAIAFRDESRSSVEMERAKGCSESAASYDLRRR